MKTYVKSCNDFASILHVFVWEFAWTLRDVALISHEFVVEYCVKQNYVGRVTSLDFHVLLVVFLTDFHSHFRLALTAFCATVFHIRFHDASQFHAL